MVKVLFLGVLILVLGYSSNFVVRKVNNGYMPTVAPQEQLVSPNPFDTKHISSQENPVKLIALSDVIPFGVLFFSIGDLMVIFGWTLIFISSVIIAWQWDREYGWLK